MFILVSLGFPNPALAQKNETRWFKGNLHTVFGVTAMAIPK